MSDFTVFACAPTCSPTLTGIPLAPSAAIGTISAQIATCQFVANTVAAQALASSSAFAPLNNATLSGTITLNGTVVSKGAQIDLAYSVAPATSTVTILATTRVQIIQAPTLTLGTPLTIVFPPPVDGARFVCTSLGAIPIKCTSTAVISNSPTSLAAGASFEYLL